MKNAIFGGVIGAVLAALVVSVPAMPRADAMQAAAAGSSDLVVVPLSSADHRQQVLLIDSRQRVLGVYQVDAASGEVALKSVRNFHWDLQLSEFNSAAPLPREIRSLVDQR
ncbi:MAG TPA: hypothetical protein VHZ24_18740 [Pirellulales bacterium]|jgi:hypothetical protein|nr:hypothetical protein [Pirellulales bacterium]